MTPSTPPYTDGPRQMDLQAAQPGAQQAAAGHMLARATWAARAFATYSGEEVQRIVHAVATAAHAEATKYAEWAVRETGFGVVEHKVRKNRACSLGLWETYAHDDFVTPRVDEAAKILSVPRPAGVVLALTPSTNPVATVYFKVLLALMTRNAIVISPHPMAKECCADAAEMLARTAVDAGAPDGVIQVVTQPSIPVVDALITDPRTNVILATGGGPMVRAAYSSGNPAIGVGPGNVPVLVDATADVKQAARLLVESKAFDNSVLCTNESVLVVEEAVAEPMRRAMESAGAAFLDGATSDRLRAWMYPEGRLNTAVVGKDAHWIADQIGLRVSPRTKLLVAPFDVVVDEEVLTHEKLAPVLGMVRVPSSGHGIEAARALVRIAGAGHSAAIHSTDPVTIMEFSARVPVLRVSVNVGNSTGSSGLDTNLAPTMTIGTGFVGRSSLGENLQPKHLVDWTRVAWSNDPAVRMPEFGRRTPWQEHTGRVPAYPWPSNDPRAHRPDPLRVDPQMGEVAARVASRFGAEEAEFRNEIRRLVVEELSRMKG